MMSSDKPYLNKKVLVLPQSTAASAAARAMHERGFGCAVVSDGKGHFSGLVTDRDLACEVLGFNLSNQTPIGEIMSDEISYVDEETTLEEILQLMQDEGIRRVPVVRTAKNGRQTCVGIVTIDDLIGMEVRPVSDLSGIIRRQIQPRKSQRARNLRSESRKENTLNRFNQVISKQTGWDVERAERMAFFLLKTIVQRISSTAAAHFITELPSLIQEDLLNLRAGPNRKITAQSIIRDLEEKFELSSKEASVALKKFWKGLGQLLPAGILRQIQGQFSDDLQKAFTGGQVLKVNKKKKRGSRPTDRSRLVSVQTAASRPNYL